MVWHTVYTIRILHAIGDGTLWCTTCNRGCFVYEYDSSPITGDVMGAHKFSSFNVIYIRFVIDCTNSQVGTVPGLILECHTYPGWRRLQTHTHTRTGKHTHTHTHTILLMRTSIVLLLFHVLNEHVWHNETNCLPPLPFPPTRLILTLFNQWQFHSHELFLSSGSFTNIQTLPLKHLFERICYQSYQIKCNRIIQMLSCDCLKAKLRFIFRFDFDLKFY